MQEILVSLQDELSVLKTTFATEKNNKITILTKKKIIHEIKKEIKTKKKPRFYHSLVREWDEKNKIIGTGDFNRLLKSLPKFSVFHVSKFAPDMTDACLKIF